MPSLKQLFVLVAPFIGLIQQVAANPDIDESNDFIARDDFESDLYVRGAGGGVIKRPGPNPRPVPPTIVVTPPSRRPRSLNRRGAGGGVIKRPGPNPRPVPPTIVVTPPSRRPRSLNRRGAGGGVIKRPGPNPRPVPPTIVVTPPQRRPGRH